jgi:hypothetical protein
MGDKKTPKNIKKFICVSCDFYSSKKVDFSRHNLTAKHQKNTERLQEVQTNSLKCISFISFKYKIEFII